MYPKKHIIALAAFSGISAALVAVTIFLNTADNFKDAFANSFISSAESLVQETVSSLPEESVTSENPGVPAIVDTRPKLSVTAPSTATVTVIEPTYTIKGTSDISQPLYINETEITRDEKGGFSYTVNLNIGVNKFTFKHKDITKTYKITYRYPIIFSYTPNTKQNYSCGAKIPVSVTARTGSTVQSKFNKQVITLTPQNTEADSPTTVYTGSFTLPKNNVRDLNLGYIGFTATYDGKSESFQSGDVICLKPDTIVDYDPNATPGGGKYVNVGSGKIAEIVGFQAEAFDTLLGKHYTRPVNNPLPKGTIDYSASEYTYNDEDIEHVMLRCGYRVPTVRKDKPGNKNVQVIKEYVGTLPDHNEVGISSLSNNGRHTVLTMDVDWKAPFYFDIAPQSYKDAKNRDYAVTNVTFNYIDITFCYATVFEGEIPDLTENPIFSSGQIIKNESDHTLRLYLKKQGGFYGWDAYYNGAGQLTFEFLNPKTVTEADNPYGTNLNGAVILIDVGHGGIDPGALGFDYKNHSEAIQNLFLAQHLKAQLISAGATVHLTRTANVTSTTDDKVTMIKRIKPDFCIAIHHNSSVKASLNGFESLYFHPFSKKAAEYIYNHTYNTGIYKNLKLKWHNYFSCRSTVCPVVLTENGYISNSFDYGRIINYDYTVQKATAITKGIVEYFNSIQ